MEFFILQLLFPNRGLEFVYELRVTSAPFTSGSARAQGKIGASTGSKITLAVFWLLLNSVSWVISSMG